MIAVAFNLYTFGQQQFGVKISGGVSKITNTWESPNATFTMLWVPSGQAGVYYNLSLNKKSSLGAELLFSQIEGKRKIEMDLIDIDRNHVGHATTIDLSHISYLSLPVYYGYTINRLTILGGAQLSYAMNSSGSSKSNAIVDGENFHSEEKSNDLNITKYEFGPRAGIVYHLTDKLAIEGIYYYGINNIQKGEPVMWKLKVQQMTLGIRYSL
jgi:opacity protein-like surface antigen